jgi:hypothetical protein
MISKRTMNRLKRIEKCQREVKLLVAEIHYVYTLDTVEDKDGWTFGMCIDQQGQVWEANASAVLLEKFKRMRDNEETK